MQSPWRKDFPTLVNNDICYLDSAATCQVPQEVIQSINQFLTNGQGNAGRGMHQLSELASNIVDSCRQKVAKFINCNPQQLIFTKCTTESINVVASSFQSQLTPNDSILVTEMEHHANLLPWQRLCQQTGAKLNILPLNNNGSATTGNREHGNLNCENLDVLLKDNCKLFAFSHCSNILGHQNPIEYFIKTAKQYGVKTLIDGAQAIPHTDVNIKKMDCDYYAFSGHKLYAPGGIGVLFCKRPDELEPLLLGGGIVTKTTTRNFLLSDDISRFEAGTSNIVGIVGLSAAINYFETIGYPNIIAHETKLHEYLSERLKSDTSFKIISHPESQSLVSFYSGTIHCHDVASILAEENIAIRAGHHCAQPCLNALGINHCLRASVGLYNDFEDIDKLIKGLIKAEKIFD